MALDDVVMRAMSKPPGDRFPSAGDLGRAAEAALSGSGVATPERTVATGAAATRESEVPAAGPPRTEERTAATRRLGPEPGRRSAPRGRRRLAIAAGLLVAAVAVAVIALSSGGGDGSSTGTAAGETAPAKAPKQGGGGAESVPRTLTEAQLIAGADAVCAQAQREFKQARGEFPQGETSPEVPYARILTGISRRQVDGFEALRPPPSLESDFDKYVGVQLRIRRLDREALRAAERGDAAAYREARAARDALQPRRYELARAIGLRECSPRP